MNRDSVLKLYDRLTGLVEKLPDGVQRPILRELVPMRELFLEQRPARVMVLGGAGTTTVPALLHFLAGVPVETGAAEAGWRRYGVADRGAIEVLDARGDCPAAAVEAALAVSRPDVVLLLRGQADAGENFEPALALAAERLARAEPAEGPKLGLVALVMGADEGEAARARLSAVLHARREFAERALHVVAAEPAAAESIAETVCGLLPNPARLEFARLTQARGAQVQIATSLLKSFTAVCGVIGVQPIPLADMPILTTLQSLLVGMVIYVSGRPASARLVAEFAGALGVSVGAGFAFREGARALLKVFPIWGNAISGIVAGAGTYAVGRAAIAYFIEDLPIQETRKLFRRLQPGLESFKARALPRLGRTKE